VEGQHSAGSLHAWAKADGSSCQTNGALPLTPSCCRLRSNDALRKCFRVGVNESDIRAFECRGV
jgi:hypothetical protein